MKILSVQDMLDVALKVHEQQGGGIGQLPLFRVVQWVNERMGMTHGQRIFEIGSLITQAQRENIGIKRTADAISFDAVVERFQTVLMDVEKAVVAARGE
jgi:hypothetical protein